MPAVEPTPGGDGRTTPRRRSLAIFAAVAFALVAGVFVVESYVSFKHPIKWDRYRHAFSEHLLDRATAYVLLFRSPFRGPNQVMPVASIQQIVREAATKHGIDACLVAAVVTFESAFNPSTITTTGAMGLMALQPTTASLLGVGDPFDPRQNVDGGTRLLRDLLTEFDGDARLAMAGYNAGVGAVRKYGRVPPFRETEDYVSQVGTIYELCRAQPASFLPTADGPATR